MVILALIMGVPMKSTIISELLLSTDYDTPTPSFSFHRRPFTTVSNAPNRPTCFLG